MRHREFLCVALVLSAAVCGLFGSGAATAQEKAPPQAGLSEAEARFVHITSDRPAYRFGEAIFYRVHRHGSAQEADPFEVRLASPSGAVVARHVHKELRPEGRLVLPRDGEGGRFTLSVHRTAAANAEPALHERSLVVYDVVAGALRLEAD
ncbi:MAG: hypothetical protein ACYTFT_12815, partial [Planctomycetota bacterium]